MNKLEMIDKAIDVLAGDFDNSLTGDNNPNRVYLWDITMAGDVDTAYQRLDTDYGYYGTYICTREEFEQRLEERNNMKEFTPKIGEVCEVNWGGNWIKCIVTNSVILRKTFGEWKEVNSDDLEFRPIKSERDIMIERAIRVAQNNNKDFVVTTNTRKMLNDLYDNGMLKLED